MVEIEGYQYRIVLLDEAVHYTFEYANTAYAFCICSSSVIKIFNLQSDEDYLLKEINGIYKEVNLKWWQKVIRFISFGFFLF